MSTRPIRTEHDRTQLLRLLGSRQMPFTVSIAKGAPRSIDQNKLQRLWLNEAAEQLGDDDAEGYRAYCKLTFGVPILYAENESFAAQYDRVIAPLTYEQRVEIMRQPIDLPVTRLMTTAQKKRYLDEIYGHFTALGAVLTDPDARGRVLYASRGGPR